MDGNSAMGNQSKKTKTVMINIIDKSARDNLVNYVNSHFCDDEVSEAKDVLWSTAVEKTPGAQTQLIDPNVLLYVMMS